jgi:hypothetical protein
VDERISCEVIFSLKRAPKASDEEVVFAGLLSGAIAIPGRKKGIKRRRHLEQFRIAVLDLVVLDANLASDLMLDHTSTLLSTVYQSHLSVDTSVLLCLGELEA